MKRLATFLSILSLTAAGTLVAAGPASADDTVCRGTISKRTIDGDLIVPKGATCAVNSLTVKGNVQVKDGATFRSYHSTVEGNVQADGFKYVRYTYGWVEGDIQLEDGASFHLRNAFVDGNIQTEGNRGWTQNIIKSRTNGDIQVFSNPAGRKPIYENRVYGNLQCKSNTPAPIGWNNRVSGDKEGQCSRL